MTPSISEISSQTLHVVAKELATTLGEARVALEAYAERIDRPEMLEKSADLLHLAHGVLRLVEVHGAALLAEEMEHVTRYLLESGSEERRSDDKRQIDGLDALMRAMVQLPAYLERVLSGGRDLALVLLPLLNDLRSVRGSPLLSEGTLLVLNLKSNESAQPQASAQSPALLAQWARRLRPRFQVGLLGFIRGERPAQNLEILAKVAEKLEEVATTQPVFQFWWVTGAILQALRSNGIEASPTLKRLLGQVDRQIKTLYEIGELRYSESPPIDLLNNLLYYVARASTTGGRIAAVRASFKLSELLPLEDAIEQERESLSAPSVKLMRTVAAAIKEDLAKVKDVFDIFVRRGEGQIADLAPQLELLKKISDTLGVLGLGELRQRVQQEITDLTSLLTSGAPPPEDALLRVASVLLSVEDSLDDQLVQLILPTRDPRSAPAEKATVEQEFRQVSEAVLRECIVNLARIKEAISTAVQRPGDFSPQGLDNVPQLLRGITAGLMMLGKGRAVELMDALGVHVRKLVEPGAPAPGAQRLERVADAIVSIEYYMETIQNGRNDPWYMLDNAAICIKALDQDLLEPVPRFDVPAAEPSATLKIDYQATMKIDPLPGVSSAVSEHADGGPHDVTLPAAAQPSVAAPAGTAPAGTAPAGTAPAGTAPPIPVAAPGAEAAAPPSAVAANIAAAGLDPQLLELFIEEAKEELAAINSNFPLWEENPMEIDALVKLRRSLHTLKGSGRMVGAHLIGAFAWSIENLVNRVIDKTLSRTPGMIAVMRAAVGALPHLIEQLETGRVPPVPIEDIMARAYALADPRHAEQSQVLLAPEDRARSEGEPVTTQPAHAMGMDPVLHDIYSKETANHLAEIRNYLGKRARQLPPHDLPESVYRAIHTLSGSSKMAEARHGIRITEPLNHYMRKVFDAGRGLTNRDLELLEDAVAAIENVVSHIDESTIFFADQPELLERISALENELDKAMASAAAEADRASLSPAIEDPAKQSLAPAAIAEATPPAAAEATLPAAAEATPPAAAVAEPFDHEIANIYSEEATELLEAAQASLNAWNGNRMSQEPTAELQRQLHTLKGGARMAGIAPMGDLSHELETLVIQIDGGTVAASDQAYAVLQSSLDELARMRDTVSGGALPNAATGQIEQIRALTSGRSLEVPEPAVRPVPIAAPPIAAPPIAAPPIAVALPPVGAVEQEHEPASSETEEFSAASLEPAGAPVLPGREAVPVERTEMARVDAEVLDTMLNNAGEVSIFRARLGQQVNSIDFNLAELARTVTRLKDQLRGMEIETEAQAQHRHQDEDPRRGDFDPLELDRYSSLQQLSRALAETSSDVGSIQVLLETLTREAQNLLTQQARVITDLQNSLMRTRMVPFQRHVQRLTRLVRQAANDTGKRAELSVDGASAELDRQVLERMVPPLEHMLRNAVVHGIESPERRTSLGKPEVGRIHVSLARDGAEVVIVVTDDGAGINTRLIREKAQALGLADRDAKLTDEEAMQLILEPGFSTAGLVTQAAGRGVGMDVVATEVKKLGGGLFIESELGAGSRFTIRLPFTLAISQALIVRVAEEVYALPMPTVEGVVRLPRSVVGRHLGKDAPLFEYGGQKYRIQNLGSFVGLGPARLPEGEVSMSVVLIRAGEHSTALVTDELIGSREIVVKNLGPQISAIRGIAGATILGDGRIVVILDMGSLVRSEWRARPAEIAVLEPRDRRTFALVVDDSITVRRVTQRLLERNGMRVLTAKDGVEAVSLLQENLPDIILLDIEMPRMDGYEVAAHVRNDQRLKHIPIVMITSRVSEKHRARAIELGVDDYLGKPYQENQLLDAIGPLVNRRSALAR
jgi:chemosensory pili system protein ChpA (sensor histidine kinase/response regulator)